MNWRESDVFCGQGKSKTAVKVSMMRICEFLDLVLTVLCDDCLVREKDVYGILQEYRRIKCQRTNITTVAERRNSSITTKEYSSRINGGKIAFN